jgi:branched-chain amino acid transport system substrate-binding protein
MRADLRRGSAVVLTAALLGLVSGCGGDDESLRVGVLVDCSGLLETSEQGELAGAELPFKQRDGAAGGRRVEIVKGCTEIGSVTLAIARARSLIEEDGAEVVVGPAGEPEGVLMRRLAPRYPQVTFILSASVAQEATLRASQPNVFRFVADGAQSAAGLATYAYRDLGWRRAAVAFDLAPVSWDATAGFVAEFCSLGGEVRSQGPLAPGAGDGALAARLARESDGVFLTTGFYDPAEFLDAYSRAVRHLPERLVLHGYGLSLPHALTPRGVDLSGVVLGGDIPRAAELPEWRRYLRAFANAYPELPPSTARDQIVVPYYVGAEGLARALERVDGDIGPGGRRLRAALERVEFRGPMGPIRLDPHRQAIVSVHLRRLKTDGERVTTNPVRVVQGVNQAYDGTFTPDTLPPALFELRCKHGDRPAWARG